MVIYIRRLNMKTTSVAAAKAQLSSLLAEVEAGHDVTITRRGKPVARLTAVGPLGAAKASAPRFDFAALRAYVAAADPTQCGLTVAQMRSRDLL